MKNIVIISALMSFTLMSTSVLSNYNSGVAIFTQAQGGLMAAAAVGGQKFKVDLKAK